MHQSTGNTAKPSATHRPALLNQHAGTFSGDVAINQAPQFRVATSFCHNAKRFGGTARLGANNRLLSGAGGNVGPTGGADETAQIPDKLRIISRDMGFDVAGNSCLIKADAAMFLHAEQTAEPVGDRQRVFGMDSTGAQQPESKRDTKTPDPHFAIPSKLHRRMIARRSAAENSQMPGFGFAPPARAPSPGALPALLALALGFAIALGLYAAFDASTRTGVQPPSAAGLSQ